MTLAIDYAHAPATPTAIKTAGYAGVIRYLSQDPTKNLTPVERDALHAAGLWILLIWETTAARALGGAPAGEIDGASAAAQATALGYPTSCPLFYAVDFAPQLVQLPAVHAYGAAFGQHWLAGPYGGLTTIDTASEVWRWQTSAWSLGRISVAADLYQRLIPTRPLSGSFDENVLLNPALPVWTPAPTPPPPAPKSRRQPDMLLFQDSTGIYLLDCKGNVHIPTVPDVQALEPQLGTPAQVSDSFGASLRGQG